MESKVQITGEHQAGFTGALPIEIQVLQRDSEAAKSFIKVHFPDG